jgi:hypothetical protein
MSTFCAGMMNRRNALRHLGEVADLVKVLGIYPAA